MMNGFERLSVGIALVLCLQTTLWGQVEFAQDTTLAFVPYACQHKACEEVGQLLRPLLPPDVPNVQLVLDRDQNRLLVAGPDYVHRIAQRLLTEVDRPTNRATSALPQRASIPQPERQTYQIPAPPSSIRQHRFISVPMGQLDRLQNQLLAVFSTKITVRTVQNRQVYLIQTGGPDANELELEFDRQRNGILLGGEGPAAQQFVALIDSLARPSRTGRKAKVFRLRRESHGQLRDALQGNSVWQAPRRRSQDLTQVPTGAGQGIIHRFPAAREAPSAPYGETTIDANGVRLVRYLFQEPDAQSTSPPANGFNAPPPASGGTDDALNDPLRQFEGVEVESLPDLDVIILRGTDEDLEQLADVIRQLERISQEAQPEIEIFLLQHVQSQAVAELLDQIIDNLVDARQGEVSTLPLVKPNAILIIGWGEAVNATVALLKELDTPVAPESQSEVFRIKHASASQVQQTLQSFFTNRGGLGPRIQVVAEPRTNSVIAHAAPRDMEEIRRLIGEMDRPQGEAVNRARVVPIQHALAADVAQTLQQAIDAAAGNGDRSAALELQTFDAEGQRILRSGTLQDIRITPNVRNNTLIISSPLESFELIMELVHQLDSPGNAAKIKVFRIVNGDATALIQTLRSLIPSQSTGQTNSVQLSATGEAGLAPLRFSVDIRSNSIIATGSEGDLRIVEALLIKLDQSNLLQRKTAVYRLKNSPAIDVANAVNQYLFNRRQLESAVPGQDNPFAEIEREVVVVPEPIANKLILAATPRYFEEIKLLIERLDESPPQVIIQVLIAEVALNSADEFGVELGLQDSVLFDRSLLGDLLTTSVSEQTSTAAGIVTTTQDLVQAATNIPGFAFNSPQPLGNSGSSAALTGAGNVGGQAISNFAVGRQNDQLGFGGLVLSASSKNLSILLRALQESRRVDVLSRPQIRTLDNQPAYIQVGQRVPRIVGSNVNQNGQSNSVALENVGLILGVTPRVSPDGTVVMEIDAEKSSLGPEQDGIPVAVSVDGTVIRSPRVDTTTAQATVSAVDGETIVLGGLITENDQYVHRNVPFLSNIPIVEHLFRYDSHVKRRTELLIILTPHVIRTSEDNERIRQLEMARMSWCACDVFALMDDVGYRPEPRFDQVDQGDPEIVFPDVNPTGEAQPAPSPEPEVVSPSLELNESVILQSPQNRTVAKN